MKYYYLIVLLFLVSCRSVQSNRTETQSESKTLKSEPQIVFYFFKALKGVNNNVTVKLIDQKTVKGVLKGVYSKKLSKEKFIQNNWVISFSDLVKQNVIQLQIKNPLIEDIEFINEEKSFEKKRIIHKSKEFVIRIPFNNSIKAIRFEKIIIKNKKLTKELFHYIKL
jgi:hypothetical protein